MANSPAIYRVLVDWDDDDRFAHALSDLTDRCTPNVVFRSGNRIVALRSRNGFVADAGYVELHNEDNAFTPLGNASLLTHGQLTARHACRIEARAGDLPWRAAFTGYAQRAAVRGQDTSDLARLELTLPIARGLRATGEYEGAYGGDATEFFRWMVATMGGEVDEDRLERPPEELEGLIRYPDNDAVPVADWTMGKAAFIWTLAFNQLPLVFANGKVGTIRFDSSRARKALRSDEMLIRGADIDLDPRFIQNVVYAAGVDLLEDDGSPQLPSVPRGLRVIGAPGDTSIEIAFDAVDRAVAYVVQINGAGADAGEVRIRSTSHVFTDLLPATRYVISAASEDGGGLRSSKARLPATTAAQRVTLPPAPLQPPPATAPRVASTTYSSVGAAVTLIWDAAAGADTYEIEAHPVAGGHLPLRYSTSAVLFTFGGLLLDATYSFRLRARNSAGPSAWSSIEHSTGSPVLPVPPPIGSAVSLDGTTATLTWTQPPAEASSTEAGVASSSTQLDDAAVETSQSSPKTYAGLSPGDHVVRVASVSDDGRRGAWVEHALNVGALARLPAPALAAGAATASTLPATWTWTPGAGDAAELDGWDYSLDGGATWTNTGLAASARAFTFGSGTPASNAALAGDTTYAVAIRARARAGSATRRSSEGAGLTLTTLAAAVAPGDAALAAPVLAPVQGSEIDANGFTVRWSHAGTGVARFQYRSSSTSESALAALRWRNFSVGGADLRERRLTGAASTRYWVQVRAVGAAGYADSPASNAVSAVTLSRASTAVAPGAPGRPMLAAGQGNFDASWAAPVDGGTPDWYEYRYFRQGTAAPAQWIRLGNALSLPAAISGLSAATAYVFEVRAGNAAGTGARSSASIRIPAAPTAAPGAVRNVRIMPNPFIAVPAVIITFDAPSAGGAVASYEWRGAAGASAGSGAYSTLGAGRRLHLPAPQLAVTLGGQYTIEVRARNAAGSGAASALTFTVASLPALPPAPNAPTISVASLPGGLAVGITPPASGTTPTGYQLRWRARAYVDPADPSPQLPQWSEPTPSARDAAIRLRAIGRLDPQLTYEVQARSVTAQQQSGWSATSTGRPSYPAPVLDPRIAAHTATSVVLAWRAAADVQTFQVRRVSAAGTEIAGSLRTIYAVQPRAEFDGLTLTSGETYYFEVRSYTPPRLRSAWARVSHTAP